MLDSLQPLVFGMLALIIFISAAFITFSRNLIYSAFALLGSFTGVAGLFAMLGADFLAVVQLLVYIGGIMVLYLFAVLMTSGIGDVRLTNRSIAVKIALPLALVLFFSLGKLIFETEWFAQQTVKIAPTTAAIGDLLLTKYLLPFELVSVLLLSTLIGSVALARQELRNSKENHD